MIVLPNVKGREINSMQVTAKLLSTCRGPGGLCVSKCHLYVYILILLSNCKPFVTVNLPSPLEWWKFIVQLPTSL